jgi:type IV pilus assembly protein PilV
MRALSKMRVKKQAGATMIEILVAILVFAIGLLAVVTAQTTGLSTTQSSLHRSYAAHLSYELVDLMRLNMTEVRSANSIFDDYDTTVDAYNETAGCMSAAQGCTTVQMAQTALSNWTDRLESELPEGKATLVNNAGMYTLSIQWADFRNNAVVQEAAEDAGVAAEDIDLIAARTTSFRL